VEDVTKRKRRKLDLLKLRLNEATPQEMRCLNGLQPSTVYRTIKEKCFEKFGDIAALQIVPLMSVKALDRSGGMLVLSVPRSAAQRMKSLIPDMHEIGSHRSVDLEVVHVAGSASQLLSTMQSL